MNSSTESCTGCRRGFNLVGMNDSPILQGNGLTSSQLGIAGTLLVPFFPLVYTLGIFNSLAFWGKNLPGMDRMPNK